MPYRESWGLESCLNYKAQFSPSSSLNWIQQFQVRTIVRVLNQIDRMDFGLHLDFASGFGRWVKLLEGRFPKQIGFDSSIHMRKLARVVNENADFFCIPVKAENLLPAKDINVLITSFRFFLNAEADDLKDFELFIRQVTSVANSVTLIFNVHGMRRSYRQVNMILKNVKFKQYNSNEINSWIMKQKFQPIAVYGFGYLPPKLIQKIPMLLKVEKQLQSFGRPIFSYDRLFIAKYDQ